MSQISTTYIVFLLEHKDELSIKYEDIVKLFKDKNININRTFYDQIIKILSMDIHIPSLKKAIKDNTPIHFEIKEAITILDNILQRSVVFIPLLPEEKYRSEAIKYVDKHLEYSLNDLRLDDYKECLSSENSLFFSEIIKCIIATDIFAKTFYYKDTDERWRWNDPQRHRHDDEIKYRERTNYASQELFEIEMDLFNMHKRDMDTRIVEYSLLSTEDVLRLDYLIYDTPIRFAACLINENSGFIAMVYIHFFIKDDIKSMGVYGIRTTIFGLHNNEKGIAKDLFNGIFQYGREVGIQKITIIKTPIGPMEDILQNMGFTVDIDKRYTKNINEYTQSNTVNIINCGCGYDIFQNDKLYKEGVLY